MPGYYLHLAACGGKLLENRSFVLGVEAPDILKKHLKDADGDIEKARAKYDSLRTGDMPDYSDFEVRVQQKESRGKREGMHYGKSSSTNVKAFWNSLTEEQKKQAFEIRMEGHKKIKPIFEKAGFTIGKDLYLAHCPERVLPGRILEELVHNDRIIGGVTHECAVKASEVYGQFVEGDLMLTEAKTAELSKCMENTFRDVNIALANELAKICRHDNMDVYEIIKICNMHPRVNILQPGPGVGGHCISVDPWFLVGDYPSLTKVIWDSMNVNDSMPDFVLNRIHEIMKENNITDFSRVGLYGLSYKENVDDPRESPTIQLLESQERHLAPPIKSYDPYFEKDIVPNQYHDFDKFLEDTDLVVIMVNHNQIKENMDKLKGKVVFDTRKCCDLPGTYRL